MATKCTDYKGGRHRPETALTFGLHTQRYLRNLRYAQGQPLPIQVTHTIPGVHLPPADWLRGHGVFDRGAGGT